MSNVIPALDSAHQFILRLSRDLRNGYRVVPYIGAGFSLSAGFPTSVVLANHLIPYWIIRALGLNPLAAAGCESDQIVPQKVVSPHLRMWSPSDGWWPEPGEEMLTPDNPNGPFCRSDAEKLLSILIQNTSSTNAGVNQTLLDESELPASLDSLERALQVIIQGDWMMMLQLLSRLTRPTTEQPQVTSGPERQSVVDSLFLHLNKKCQPALSHEMLAALQHHWRCRVILTTNFDSLIERAFAAAGEPLESFEVGKTSPLPDANLVLAQSSLVKLHGGRFDVRADVTVGSPLAREDIKNAMSYVAARSLFSSDVLQVPAAPDDKVALVFFGCGDSDERTASFAQYVRQHFPNRSKAYWISYTAKRVESIKTLRLFPAHRKFAAHYSDFGLLLLSLFEHINRTIPSSGTIFPGPWQLTTPPRIPSQDAPDVTGRLDKARLRVREYLFDCLDRKSHDESSEHTECLDDGKKYAPKLGVMPLHLSLSEENYAGAAICMAFFERSRDYNFTGLWIDLDEVTMPAGALIRVSMMIYRIEGVNDPLITLDTEGLNTRDGAEAFLEVMRATFRRHYAETGVPVIAFFNASEIPGNDALFRLKKEENCDRYDRKNRWSGPEGANQTEQMLRIVAEMTKDKSCGFSAVFITPGLPRRGAAATHRCEFDRLLLSKLERSGEWRELSFSRPCTEFHPDKVAEIAFNWFFQSPEMSFPPAQPHRVELEASAGTTLSQVNEREVRGVFLASIIKFRHSRHPSSIARSVYTYFQESMALPAIVRLSISESAVHEKVDEWLAHLECHRVLRRRDGGFVWMNNRVKRILQHWFESSGSPIDCLLLHGCIGRWYARLLHGCGDPLATKEGISHHIEGIRWMLTQRDNTKRGDNWFQTSLERADSMLRHAKLLLNTSRILFERRVATTFSERTFLVLLEESRTLQQELNSITPHASDQNQGLDDRSQDIGKLIGILRRSTQELVDELSLARARIALREGNYRSVTMTTFQNDSVDISCCAAAAFLHLREYDNATKLFQRLWNDIIGKVDKNHALSTGDLWASPRGEAIQFAQAPGNFARTVRRELSLVESDERLTRRLIALSGWGVYLHLNRSQAEWVSRHASQGGSDITTARRSRLLSLKCAEWFLQFGLALLRTASDVGDGELFDENVLIRAHGALLIAVLNTEHLSDLARADDAWRLHSDAASFFGGFPVSHSGLTSAIVNLRAAEICLLEVMRHRPFAETRRILRRLAIPASSPGLIRIPKTAADILNQLDDNPNAFADGILQKGQCETLAVKVSEGLDFLDKAEQILGTHPKSRWWWWIFAVLKTKACEYLYVLRLARAIAANAGQGLEPRIVPPTAFLFIDSGLMKLVLEKDVQDQFYLARIISSLVETYRCEVYYSSLYSSDNPRLNTFKRQQRSAAPLLAGRVRLIKHLNSKLERMKKESSSDGLCVHVQNYTEAVLEKVRALPNC